MDFLTDDFGLHLLNDELASNVVDPLISGLDLPEPSGSKYLLSTEMIDKNALDCYIPENQMYDYPSSSSSSPTDGYASTLQVHASNPSEYFLPAKNINNNKKLDYRFVPIKPSMNIVQSKPKLNASEERKLKNRHYAQVSRDKKKKQDADILGELEKLRRENDNLRKENAQLRGTIQQLTGSTPPLTPLSENSPTKFENFPTSTTNTFMRKALFTTGAIVVFCLVVLMAPSSSTDLKYGDNMGENLAVLQKNSIRRPNRLVVEQLVPTAQNVNISSIPVNNCGDIKTEKAIGGSSDVYSNASAADKNRNLDKLATIIRQKRDSVYILATKDNLPKPKTKRQLTPKYFPKTSFIATSANKTLN